MYDIIAMIWFFADHCKFVSKKELGKGIPSVSYNLRHGVQFLLIERSQTSHQLLGIG
jgi:1-acyl-sn-glycerol-3-phosphate acyltransferase